MRDLDAAPALLADVDADELLELIPESSPRFKKPDTPDRILPNIDDREDDDDDDDDSGCGDDDGETDDFEPNVENGFELFFGL
jgi:hypothetical protein